ncbi:cell wall-binding repeat-containing protein [Herbiconiux sp. UC225_62]|uniref:cell wall-binding repeat-containing protein n=1 Tax=Herbiconiux sp. UC225_62 TaxID=3350168 RepID=UPI0036D3CA4F
MRSRFLSLGGAAAASLVVSAALLLAAAPAAQAIAPSNPVCPPTVATQGISLPRTFALDYNDPSAHVAISEGSLPAGVALTGDETAHLRFAYSGTPTASGIANFTVTATISGNPVSIACSMAVFPTPTTSRIGGADRYAQADALAHASFQTSNIVYVASGEKFTDALSAGSVAGLRSSALLLTPANAMTPGTKAEITRLQPHQIVVVGGPASVAPAVEQGLVKDFPGATVTRIGGADRYDVSRSLLSNPSVGAGHTDWLSVANGGNFPDALSASPAAIARGGAVLLVDGSKTVLSDSEKHVLDGLGADQVSIAGGPASVSAALEHDISTLYPVTRNGGADRFDVAVSINNEVFGTADTVYLASGSTFPDALSAAPVAGAGHNPVYLAHTDCVPGAVLQEIVRIQPSKIVVLGGANTLTAAVEALKPC